MLATGLPALRPSVGLRAKAVRGSRMVTCMSAKKSFDDDWLSKNPIVPMAAFIGWTVPSNIPVGALGGKSLFGCLTQSIGENLAHFPVGPQLDDKFWLYMITWHVGLFVTMVLGQVGVNGRKEGYW